MSFGDLFNRVDGLAALVVEEDVDLVLEIRIAHAEAQQETVELGLGEGIGALVVDGVLRREYTEGPGQGPRAALDAHL